MQPRLIAVSTTVVLAHAAALWLLQLGLQSRPAETLVAAEVLMEWVAPLPAQPPTATPRPTAQAKPAPARALPQPAPSIAAPTPAAAVPVAAPVAKDAPDIPTAVPAPPHAAATGAPASPAAAAPAVAAAGPAQATAPAAPRIELPSSQADYLNNPRPPYPPLSKRLGEEGRVVLRVRIEADGTASQAEVQKSSGYDRLDQTALQTVLRWRYVPGKRNGVPEAMWFNIPIQFVLE